MTEAQHKSDSELTMDTPYPNITAELWGVYCEDLEENWQRYNDTTLYSDVVIWYQ